MSVVNQTDIYVCFIFFLSAMALWHKLRNVYYICDFHQSLWSTAIHCSYKTVIRVCLSVSSTKTWLGSFNCISIDGQVGKSILSTAILSTANSQRVISPPSNESIHRGRGNSRGNAKWSNHPRPAMAWGGWTFTFLVPIYLTLTWGWSIGGGGGGSAGVHFCRLSKK